MGLFEWLGEGFNPGPLGRINHRPVEMFPKVSRIGALALMILGFVMLYFMILGVASSDNLRFYIPLLLGYLAAAFFLTPEPDTRNLGWFGGLMNNPFRFSDNLNRYLVL